MRPPLPAASRTDWPAQVLDVQKLVPIAAAADDGKASPLAGPAVEQLEGSQPLGADERLRPEHAHAQAPVPETGAQVLGLDLRAAVDAHAGPRVRLGDRAAIGDAVDGCRRNKDKALHAAAVRFFQEDPRSRDLGRQDVRGAAEGKRSRGMHEPAGPGHQRPRQRPVADVASHELYAPSLRAVDLLPVEHRDRPAPPALCR